MTTSLEQSIAWSAIRADAIESFNGQTPRPEDEAVIIDLFELQPALVQRAIEEIATAHHAGKVTWAWSALRARLERGAQALREARVDVTTSRSKAVGAAERWLENAGLLYDLEVHVVAELFGENPKGILYEYRGDADLRLRMIAKWRELRPRGELADQQAEAWAAECREGRLRAEERRREAHRKTLEQLTSQQPAPAGA